MMFYVDHETSPSPELLRPALLPVSPGRVHLVAAAELRDEGARGARRGATHGIANPHPHTFAPIRWTVHGVEANPPGHAIEGDLLREAGLELDRQPLVGLLKSGEALDAVDAVPLVPTPSTQVN